MDAYRLMIKEPPGIFKVLAIRMMRRIPLESIIKINVRKRNLETIGDLCICYECLAHHEYEIYNIHITDRKGQLSTQSTMQSLYARQVGRG